MASGSEDSALKDSLDFLSSKGKLVTLKAEQELAIRHMLKGEDVLAVLPTGFGKSMIFTVFGIAEKFKRKATVTVLIICPLKSIIADQLDQLQGVCSAGELTNESLEKILDDPPSFIYSSAEQVLEARFLSNLKDTSSKLHQRISAIVVDESHIVETWTGMRKVKCKGKRKPPFREAYSKLSILRSLCEGVPLLAITGTADQATQNTITKLLLMSAKMITIFISPNRVNLKFHISKVKKNELMGQLSWLAHEVKNKGIETPQTIIFCCSLKDIATVVNWLLMMLGDKAFYPSSSTNRNNCLIAIYHSLTNANDKERIANNLKKVVGTTRIVLATTALSMGVNFPCIRRVIMYGPPRSMLDFHQEAGRAGRDSLPAQVLLYYHGQQSTHCEDHVKKFLNSTGCVRVASYKSLDDNVKALPILHDCCSVCALACNCGAVECCSMDAEEPKQSTTENIRRVVTPEEDKLLRKALVELQESVNTNTMSAFGTLHGFSTKLIEEVLGNSDKIFCLEDIMTLVPVFCRKHAVMILEILEDIFEDCQEASLEELDDTDVHPLSSVFDIQSLIGSVYEEDEVLCADLDIL